MLDFALPALKLLHHRQKIIFDRAANAAIWKVMNFDSALLAGGAQKSAINRDFAKLVDQYRQAAIRILSQKAADQCGFAGSKKPGDDCYRYFHKDIESLKSKTGCGCVNVSSVSAH